MVDSSSLLLDSDSRGLNSPDGSSSGSGIFTTDFKQAGSSSSKPDVEVILVPYTPH